jgi:hypothetical protein
MKQVVKNYTFSKTAGTVTFSDFSSIRLDRILLITDVTNNTVIYQFNTSSLGGTVSTNVLTLTYVTNTASFNNTDALQIFYDSASGDPIYDLPIVEGNIASGATDSGNPVKVGGIYSSTAPTLINGQRGNLQLDSSANLKVNVAAGSLSGSSSSIAVNDGSSTANVVAGDTGFNGLSTASASKTYTFTTSTSGAQTILGNTPTEGFSTIEVVYTAVGSGLGLNGQWSNASGGTYVTAIDFGTGNAVPTNLGTTVSTVYISPVHGNYFQIAVSALSSGTFSGWVRLNNSATTYAKPSVSATQTGTWNVTGNAGNNSGTITSNSSSIVSGALQSYSNLIPITVYGTYSGVSFGITVTDNNGGNYWNTPIYDQNNMRWLASGSTITPGTNVSNIYWVPTPPNSSSTLIRVLASAYTSGTTNVRIGGGLSWQCKRC